MWIIVDQGGLKIGLNMDEGGYIVHWLKWLLTRMVLVWMLCGKEWIYNRFTVGFGGPSLDCSGLSLEIRPGWVGVAWTAVDLAFIVVDLTWTVVDLAWNVMT